MATVMIRMPAADLSNQMAAMREWLNERRYEPSRFACDRYGSIFAVCVDFSKDEEAEAFKDRFSPQEVSGRSPILVMQRPKPETMEQVYWWRLMAEEVRTEAEEFASDDARDMMTQVALSFDRMARNLEHRLANSTGRVLTILG